MSGKDKETNLCPRKKSRRQTDILRSAIENENEDCKRFPYFLGKYCDENCVPYIPQVNGYVIKEDGNIVPVEQPSLLGLYKTQLSQELSNKQCPVFNAYADMNLSLRKLTCKTTRMDLILLSALNKTISHFPSLVTLKLDDCGLTSAHIKLLEEHFRQKQHVKELHIKGNPNPEQNFYILINCGLKILNLKLCGIDENGLEKIANEFLNLSPDSALIHLDLSSNMVFDEGCKQVARILRCDRTLQSLNLSDCKIRDEGFEDIIKCFTKFSLSDEELYTRRKLRFEFFKLLQKKTDKSSQEKNSSVPEVMDQKYFADPLAVLEEKMNHHPFITDCIQDDCDLVCMGNHKLESLNISYNHLTKPSFDLLLKTIVEQQIRFGHEKGLHRLILDGNLEDPKVENIRNAIDELILNKKLRKSTTSSVKSKGSYKRKKSGSVTTESSVKIA